MSERKGASAYDEDVVQCADCGEPVRPTRGRQAKLPRPLCVPCREALRPDDLRARETRRALAQRRQSGKPTSRPSVYEDRVLVSRIKLMREQGLSLRQIADQLNGEGVPTLRGGTCWRPSSVQSALGYRRPYKPLTKAERAKQRRESRKQNAERWKLVALGRTVKGQRELDRLAKDAGGVGKSYTAVRRLLQDLDRLPYAGREHNRLEREAMAGLHAAEDALGLWLRLDKSEGSDAA